LGLMKDQTDNLGVLPEITYDVSGHVTVTSHEVKTGTNEKQKTIWPYF